MTGKRSHCLYLNPSSTPSYSLSHLLLRSIRVTEWRCGNKVRSTRENKRLAKRGWWEEQHNMKSKCGFQFVIKKKKETLLLQWWTKRRVGKKRNFFKQKLYNAPFQVLFLYSLRIPPWETKLKWMNYFTKLSSVINPFKCLFERLILACVSKWLTPLSTTVAWFCFRGTICCSIKEGEKALFRTVFQLLRSRVIHTKSSFKKNKTNRYSFLSLWTTH